MKFKDRSGNCIKHILRIFHLIVIREPNKNFRFAWRERKFKNVFRRFVANRVKPREERAAEVLSALKIIQDFKVYVLPH